MARKPDGRPVLIVRFSALGDVALSIPSVYSVCRQYPRTRFVMITRPGPAQLFINPPENLTIEAVDTTHCRGVRRIVRLAASLNRRYRPGTIVDLHDVLRTKLIRLVLGLSGVRVACIRKGRWAKRALTRRHNPRHRQLASTSARYAGAFARAGYPAADSFLPLCAPGLTRGDEMRIAVAPFARHAGKEYPIPLMEETLSTINRMLPEARIILFGNMSDPREWKQMTAWEAKYPFISLEGAGENLDRQLGILAGCRAMLSMDSANMHLASLVGVPVVSVWGATHPFAGFMGYGQSAANAVQLDMECRPCSVFGNKPCRRGDLHCLRAIPPARVADAVASLAAAKSGEA